MSRGVLVPIREARRMKTEDKTRYAA